MNDISEENKNQKMNTETLEKHGTNLSELTGQETMEELLGIYESSLKKFEEGQVVTGTVISVGRNMVLVDVGYKSEGQISIREFIDEDGNIKVKVGDKFEVMIEV
ncbi:MAG: S1 RNA-binding domain-containing protein, partial [Proteobacteria bacterium]|nr:S1 RNA-binding domain-containing protein [Pseudomonadota bacterium]